MLIASRDATCAVAAADELRSLGAGAQFEGGGLIAAGECASIVVMTVPYAAQLDTACKLKWVLSGKIPVDVAAPLVPPRVSHVQLPAGRSSVAAIHQELGENVSLAAAFQHVSAYKLKKLDDDIASDVLVCANSI